MTPERWQQVKDLFGSALGETPAQRAAFLASACGGDDDLRTQVESMIAAHEQDGDFIEAPAFERAMGLFAGGPAEAVAGRHVGPYKIARELGHGGMGAVYLAVRADDQYQKRVALKLVRRGMDTQDILRRFRHERQILASLNHPFIAQLLDGGTTEDGLPYFAMEYVEGQPITDYCDTHRLTIAERLKLFRPVCAAVHYAHQNLVVHRDLKPSNILITADGTPKLLDFGIAKLLNPELSAQTIDPTATALRLMTPEYASPEQVRGDPVTTASDVYSLGVVLYELLTGHRPYRLKSRSPHEILHVVCEEEPEKPSTAASRVEAVVDPDGATRATATPESVSRTREGQPEKLRRRLKGDLDNIVLMAMRKEPQRRYATVNQLSEDIRRHLEGQPVVARKDTFGYRAEKFVKRNKAGVAAAALVLITLIGGIVATWQQAREARQERANAQQRFNDVRELATSFLFELHKEIETLPGSIRAQEKLVNRALETYDKLAKQAGDDRSLQLDLAAAYSQAGHIQWNRYYANLGNLVGAMQSERKALEIREQVVKADPKNELANRGLATSYLLFGDLLIATEKTGEAMENYRKSLKVREEIVAGNPKDTNARRNLALSYQRVGDHLGNPGFPNLGDRTGALENHRKALKIREELVEENPKNADDQHSLGIQYEKIRDLQWAMGDREGAFNIYHKTLKINEKLVADYPHNARYRRDLAVAHWKMADMLKATGDTARALENIGKTQKIFEEMVATDQKNAKAREDLVRTARWLSGFAAVMVKSGQTAEARRVTMRALAIHQEQAERPGATASDLNGYAWALLTVEPSDLRSPATARSYAKRAVEMSANSDPSILDTLAEAYHLTGDHAGAVETQEKALALLKSDSPSRQEFEDRLAKFRAAAKGKQNR
jgi:non-specific serine/threonine protein kinase/serine/threonine-protein kinase